MSLYPAASPVRARSTRPAAQGWPSTPEVDGFTWELGPDPADAQFWAEQNPDHHTTEETPAEALGDGPDPDWDALAEESAARDSYERGHRPA